MPYGMTAKHVAMLAGCAIALVACDKLGLGSKGSDGGVTTGAPGANPAAGVLSFLGGTFEGEITMNMAGRPGAKTGPQTMVFGIKSPRVRIDGIEGIGGNSPALGQGGAFIIDPPQKKGFILMPAKKMAMVIDFDKAKSLGLGGAPGKAGAAPATPAEPPKIEKTGKKSVIAGYECEEWKVTSKDSRAELCVAEGIKWIDLGDLGMASPEVALAAAAGDANRFPLRLVAFDAKGVETTRMEATKVEKKTLADTQFVVPPGYQVIDVGALMGGFGQGGAGKGPPGLPPGLPPGFVPPQKTR